MNWFQKNPFLGGFLVVAILAAAGAAYFSYSAYTKFSEASNDYDAAVSRLHSLQNRTPFPSKDNLEAYAKLNAAYDAKFDELLAHLAERQAPIEPVTPQVFQDTLRAVVSEVTKLASENGVELPEGFYLGFDQYRGTLPSDIAAPILANQLVGINDLVTNLVNLRVNAIVSINRVSLPEEGGTPVRAPATDERPRRGAAQPASEESPAEPILVVNPVDIAFSAEQARLRQALNGIVTSDRFLILRSLTVQNSQTDGPLRQLAGMPATPASGPTADDPFAALLGGQTNETEGGASAQSALSVIVGREVVTLSARIEMIRFNLPETTE